MKQTSKLSNLEISSFCGQMALILKAGITPRDGLDILLHDSKDDNTKEFIQTLLTSSQQGNSFTTSIKESGFFPEYVENMVAIGEESGKLDHVMQSLNDYYEREEMISENVRNAITYPLIMIVMMLLVVILLITKVLPLFNQVFIQLGTEITGFSASLLHIGQVIQSYSIVFIILLVLFIALYLYFTKTSHGRLSFAHICSSIKLTRKFYDNIAYGRFANGMALTLSSGMGIYQSLDMVSQLVDYREMEKKIATCKQAILDGDNFAEALIHSHIFNNLYSRMIAIGVKTGNVDVILEKIASNYEEETDKKIRLFISVLEPTLVISLSLIVGLILLSVILPLIGIMTSMG